MAKIAIGGISTGGGGGAGVLLPGPEPNEFATTAARDAAEAGIHTLGAAYGRWRISAVRPSHGRIQINESLREVAISVRDQSNNSHAALIGGANPTIVGETVRFRINDANFVQFTINSRTGAGTGGGGTAYTIFSTSEMQVTGALTVNNDGMIHPIETEGGADWLAAYDGNEAYSITITDPDPDEFQVRRGNEWVNAQGIIPIKGNDGPKGDPGDNTTPAEIDARIAPYARAVAPSGTIDDARIPPEIMRDAELTATAVRNLLGLTSDEANDLLTGAVLSGQMLTFNQNDGTTVVVTLPQGTGGMADGVVQSGAFSNDGTSLVLTLTTGATVTISVPELLRTSNAASLLEDLRALRDAGQILPYSANASLLGGTPTVDNRENVNDADLSTSANFNGGTKRGLTVDWGRVVRRPRVHVWANGVSQFSFRGVNANGHDSGHLLDVATVDGHTVWDTGERDLRGMFLAQVNGADSVDIALIYVEDTRFTELTFKKKLRALVGAADVYTLNDSEYGVLIDVTDTKGFQSRSQLELHADAIPTNETAYVIDTRNPTFTDESEDNVFGVSVQKSADNAKQITIRGNISTIAGDASRLTRIEAVYGVSIGV